MGSRKVGTRRQGEEDDDKQGLREESRISATLVCSQPYIKSGFDRVSFLSTLWRNSMDPDTANAVVSTEHKRLVQNAACFLVSISTTIDANEIWSTGIVVSWDGTKKSAKILACSKAVCANSTFLDPKPKIFVRLPKKDLCEGRLLFFNDHYDIALLEISVDFPLQHASFGSSPNYGHEVIVLARDHESSLRAGRGTILWLEAPEYFRSRHHFFLSCELSEGGSGGPVIDDSGNVTGMAFDDSLNPTVLGISTILTCIEMWTKFSRVARPMLGMSFRTVELLDVSLQEEILYEHNIDNGFIVYEVCKESTSERLGIHPGDVIVSLHGQCSTLPQMEDFLLSLGWEFLQSIDSDRMVHLKLEVYDPVKRERRNITLPIEFSYASEQVE